MSAAAKACWSEIVENLNKGPDTDGVPLDANFCIAFELALDLDPLDDASKRAVFEKLDRSKDGTGAVQGGEAVSDNLGAAAKSAEDAATGLSADSESASGKSRATMDLSGVRFELKLIFPIEMIFRLLLNQLARSIATGADLANALKVETKRLQEGINALRVAKLMAAHDALVELLACVQTVLGLSKAEKEKAVSKMSSDCRHVVELSTEAYRTVKSNHEKTLAVRTACSAIVLRLFEEPPKLVYAALTDQVKKLVSEKFVTNAIKTHLAGGSVLSSASKRIAILHPVLDICHDLYVFAYKYGLPEPALGGEPGLIVYDKGGVAFSALAESTKHSWRGDHVLLEGHDEPIGNICVTPDGTRALTGGLDKTAKIWDLASGACIHTLEGHLRNTVYVCVTPDSTHAVTACNDGYAKVWNLASGLCVRTLKGHQRGVPSVCVTPDGTRALTASYDGTAKVWDLASGRCFRTLVGHTDHVYDICVTPDGTRALTWSADKTAKVWDLASGACIHTLPKGHPRGFSFVCVTPESTSALTATYDGTVKVWDLASGRCVRTLKCHEEPIDNMCFTPDGTHALTASRDTTAKIWDLASGACIRTLVGHTDALRSVCVTPDGTRALTASSDGTVKVWDLASGLCVRTLVGHTDELRSVCVTPDGTRALTASSDGTVRYAAGLTTTAMSAAAKACWSEIVENLNKGPDTDGVPLDANFCIAFELALDLDPLDDASKRAVFEKLDRSKDGTVSRLEFLSYHRGWVKAGGAASPAVAATEALPVASVAASPLSAEAPLPVGLQGAVQGGEAVSDNLGAAAKSAEDAATGLSADGKPASGKTRTTMDLAGVRFELKLTFPIEMIFRLLLNQFARSIEATDMGADLADALKVETKRLQEGINALRVAKLMAAHDALVELLACVQTVLGLSKAEKEKAVSKMSSDCRHVVELSTEAYRTVKSNHEKTLAVRTACSAIVLRLFEEPPKLVYAALTAQVKKLVSEKFVTDAIKTQLAGGSVLSSASKRNAILHPVLDICRDLCVFAYKHGLEEPALGGEPGLIVYDKGGVTFSALAESTKQAWDLDFSNATFAPEGHKSDTFISEDGQRKQRNTFISEYGQILAVCVTPDGTRALAASSDNTVKIWDLPSGICIRTLVGHTCSVKSICVTPDGTHALTASSDGTAKVWDLASSLCVRTLEHGMSEKIVRHHRGSKKAPARPRKTIKKPQLYCVCVAPDGTRALTASEDKTVYVWDLASSDFSGACIGTLVGHTRAVLSICVAPDGTRALTASEDNTAKVWDLASGACMHTLVGHGAGEEERVKKFGFRVFSACFTPDGTRALTASQDKTAKVWDLTSGLCVRTLVGHTNSYDTHKGRPVAPSKNGVFAACVTPDGMRALTASGDETAKVWDLASGLCVRTLVGHTGLVWSACVTPDGMRALTASSDGTVKVWDLTDLS
ncbi:hypothetical protein JL721_11894 [Aureococcus anophagefferens]|nr:hypothetical protein JL721_11894 [Aureococcus anophagefferens]